MKKQPHREKLAFEDPLYSFALLVIMASILYIVYMAVGLLFHDESPKRQLTIGGSFVIGEVVDTDGQTSHQEE